MVQQPLKISAILLAVILLAGTIFGIATILGTDLLAGFNAYATNDKVKHEVTTSPGLKLKEVIDAFLVPAVRDEKDTQNILIFSKSGGFAEEDNKQWNLKVDLPIIVTERTADVSFQYFVDVKGDLTPGMAHCSDIKLHVYLDDKYLYTTGWMGYDGRFPKLPLQTDMITIEDVKKGNHDIALKPEGRISGCNVEEYIFSWGGTAVVYKFDTPRASVQELLGHWKFDEAKGTAAIDVSGNKNSGILVNGGNWQDKAACIVGDSCLSFDGINDYVSIPDSTSLEQSRYTFAAWIKIRQQPGTYQIDTILQKGTGNGNFDRNGYGFDYRDENGVKKISVYHVDSVNNFHQLIVDRTLKVGVWYHVAATYDGSELKLFVNGSRIGIKSVIANPDYVGDFQNLKIAGGDPSVPAPPFTNVFLKGSLDDIRVYKQALSDNEIQQLYRER